MAITPDILIAPWQPANGASEAVGVRVNLTSGSTEGQIWNALFNSIEPFIDKDFYFASTGAASITVSHESLGNSGIVGYADYYDHNVNNQSFGIAIDATAIRSYANSMGYDYATFYKHVAAHELGHALGLKHPFDSINGTYPYDTTADGYDTVMAYDDDGYGLTALDLAALIEVNGIEDDKVGDESPVFRFYNKGSGGHFFTASAEEAEFVATTLYNYFQLDGTAFYASAASTQDNNLPIYRFYNEHTGGHFFTASAGERDFVQNALASQYHYEGVGFYASSSDNDQSEAVYRFYNEAAGGHFYTSSTYERDLALTSMAANFNYEGVAFYA